MQVFKNKAFLSSMNCCCGKKIFLPESHNLNGRCLLDDTSSSRTFWLKTRRFLYLFNISECRVMWPMVLAIHNPEGMIYTNLVEVYRTILQTHYLISRPFGFLTRVLKFILYQPMNNEVTSRVVPILTPFVCFWKNSTGWYYKLNI